MIKLGGGPLDDGSCKISKLKAICFLRRRFLKISIYKSMQNMISPGAGPFLERGS